jgi:hypothetical protein
MRFSERIRNFKGTCAYAERTSFPFFPAFGKIHPISDMRLVLTFLIAITAAWLAAGCSTPRNGSQRLASIIVDNRSPEQIEASLVKVYESHGYSLKRKDDELVFEKPGTVMNTLAYGDWYNGGVWERIEVFQREIGPGRTLVDCDDYMVQEPEDPFFQKVRQVHKTRRRNCQKLLDAVSHDLASQPASPPANR